MEEPRNAIERLHRRIRNHPLITLLALLGGLVIGLSAFTDAARNLASLFGGPARAAVNGDWQAEVQYDWPGGHHTERFRFHGEGDALYGSASFLGRPRGVLEGSLAGERLSFVTRTRELGSGDAPGPVTLHRYQGRLQDDTIRFQLITEGGQVDHAPVQFVARRLP